MRKAESVLDALIAERKLLQSRRNVLNRKIQQLKEQIDEIRTLP